MFWSLLTKLRFFPSFSLVAVWLEKLKICQIKFPYCTLRVEYYKKFFIEKYQINFLVKKSLFLFYVALFQFQIDKMSYHLTFSTWLDLKNRRHVNMFAKIFLTRLFVCSYISQGVDQWLRDSISGVAWYFGQGVRKFFSQKIP